MAWHGLPHEVTTLILVACPVLTAAFILVWFIGCSQERTVTKEASSETGNRNEVDFPAPQPVVPDTWPKTIVLHDKSGNSSQHDSEQLYFENYIRGWEFEIWKYCVETDSELDIPFRCQTGYEREADWAGRDQCKRHLHELEKTHGKKSLVEYLRRSSNQNWD